LGRSPDEKQEFYRGVIHLYAGDREEAVAAFERGMKLDSTSVWSLFGRGYRGIALRRPDEVATVLRTLEERVVVDGERHYRLVHFAAFLDERERAADHLAATIRGGFFNVPYIGSDPLTAGMRDLNTFSALLEMARDRRSEVQALLDEPLSDLRTSNPNGFSR